jgi:hypothetical protein
VAYLELIPRQVRATSALLKAEVGFLGKILPKGLQVDLGVDLLFRGQILSLTNKPQVLECLLGPLLVPREPREEVCLAIVVKPRVWEQVSLDRQVVVVDSLVKNQT